MEAKELRIGNLWDTGDFYGIDSVEIYEIYQFLLMEKGGSVADFYHNIKPVQLTEEWLLKFGFKKCYKIGVEGFNYMIDTLRLDKMGEYYYLWEGNHPIIEIKYVHKLQNLYFALTGEELTLKN